ncbi:MAG: protein translocase subunit SecD [Fibrobacter sp.]|jgi:SecD/SecF fusion protein|nr:protein translocase subunit SecD [Fibrobacter sp.]
MKKNTPIRILLVLATVIVAIYFLIPSVTYYSKTPEQRELIRQNQPNILKKILNLGLDLQGGMRLVLEIDRSKLENRDDKDVLDRAYTVIENRINALGVAEPIIQKQGNDRIIVELPGLKDEAAAKSVIGKTAQLEFNLVREPDQLRRALSVIDNVLTGKEGPATADSSEKADSLDKKEQEAIANRLFKSEKSNDSAADSSATDAATSAAKLKDLLVQMGDQVAARMDHVGKVNAILTRDDVQQALKRAGLGNNSFLWDHDTTNLGNSGYRVLYYVKGTPEMRGDVIKNAQATIGQSEMRGSGAKVDIEMNAKGARTFSSVTAANRDKFLAIVLDSTVYSAPRIIQKIPFGKAEITGNFTMEEAKNLAIVLRAGALPAPVKIIQEQVVGPSLGQDSIEKGLFAGLIGAVLVVLFILIYYRMSGLIALIALAINILIILAVMAGIHATLTLPGIAAIILLIGMNVDANVIIFERIREELRLGKTATNAIKSGYETAFVTIMDSNLTTLITAFILLWKGTGPIRGFAVTMILGIVASLFTALFVSKVLMDMLFQKNKNTLSI